jgi:antitoxin (DNA-binding transcriptional repressor) of toxin-antitoxin stability system
MRAVGLSQLKSRLGEYVRQVRRGKELLITDRGAVMAMLAKPARPDADLESALSDLASAGELHLGRPSSPGLYPRQKALSAGSLSQQLLAAERGDA